MNNFKFIIMLIAFGVKTLAVELKDKEQEVLRMYNDNGLNKYITELEELLDRDEDELALTNDLEEHIGRIRTARNLNDLLVALTESGREEILSRFLKLIFNIKVNNNQSRLELSRNLINLYTEYRIEKSYNGHFIEVALNRNLEALKIILDIYNDNFNETNPDTHLSILESNIHIVKESLRNISRSRELGEYDNKIKVIKHIISRMGLLDQDKKVLLELANSLTSDDIRYFLDQAIEGRNISLIYFILDNFNFLQEEIIEKIIILFSNDNAFRNNLITLEYFPTERIQNININNLVMSLTPEAFDFLSDVEGLFLRILSQGTVESIIDTLNSLVLNALENGNYGIAGRTNLSNDQKSRLRSEILNFIYSDGILNLLRDRGAIQEIIEFKMYMMKSIGNILINFNQVKGVIEVDILNFLIKNYSEICNADSDLDDIEDINIRNDIEERFKEASVKFKKFLARVFIIYKQVLINYLRKNGFDNSLKYKTLLHLLETKNTPIESEAAIDIILAMMNNDLNTLNDLINDLIANINSRY